MRFSPIQSTRVTLFKDTPTKRNAANIGRDNLENSILYGCWIYRLKMVLSLPSNAAREMLDFIPCETPLQWNGIKRSANAVRCENMLPQIKPSA